VNFLLWFALYKCLSLPLCAELPVHITVPLKPEEQVTEGDTLVLHAEVSKPNVAGTWFKDEFEIIPKVDKKYDAAVSETVHELTIHDVTTEDQAEYTLEIGEESTTAVLKVQGILTVLIIITHIITLIA